MINQGAIQMLEKVSDKKSYFQYLQKQYQMHKDSEETRRRITTKQSIINDPDLLHALFNDPLNKGNKTYSGFSRY